MPIYATLCSNDYLIIDNFVNFFNQIMKYSNIRKNTSHIKNSFYRNLINFILDIVDDLNINDRKEITKEEKQNLIIDEILKRKEKETDEKEETIFKNNLINSVKEYNLTNLNNNNNPFDSVVCKEIIKKYNSGSLNDKLIKSNIIFILKFIL